MLISNFRNSFTTTTKYSCMMRVKDSRLKHCGQKNLDFLTPDVAIFVPDSISEKFQLMRCTSIFLCDIKRWDNFCKQNTENNQTSCMHTQTKARHGTNPVFLRLYGRSQCRGLKATAGAETGVPGLSTYSSWDPIPPDPAPCESHEAWTPRNNL